MFFKKQGQTGFPWIDAIMTQLREEGWIHHLARHAVACFLTRGDLWISWEEGMKVKCRLLLLAFINILEKVNELFEILHYLLRNYFCLFISSCFLFAFVAFICKNIYIFLNLFQGIWWAVARCWLVGKRRNVDVVVVQLFLSTIFSLLLSSKIW